MATQVLELYTTNAVLLSKALTSVVHMVGSGAFSDVLYMAALIGFVAMITNFALGTGKVEWVGYVLAIFLASTGVKTTTTVGLVDSAGGAYRVVQNVPVIIAVPFYIINSGARVLTDLGKFYFSAAGSDMLQNGVGYGTALIASMQNIRWKEADIAVSSVSAANKSEITVRGAIEGYINECYIPYISKSGSSDKVTSVLYKGTTAVTSTADVWDLFNSHITRWGPNHIATTGSGNPQASCDEQFSAIKTVLTSQAWKDAILNDFASTYYSLSSSMDRPGSSSAAPAGTAAALNADQLAIRNDLKKYINYMLGTSGGNEQAATILLMDYLSKALNVGLSQDGRVTLTEYQGRAGSAFDDAIGQNNLRMAAEGDFFVKYAGNMTRFIEFLTYLWLPITLFAMLAMPGGIKQLKNIFFLYLWIQSWPFAFNIINYFQVLNTLESLSPILSGGINMFDVETIWASTTRAFATSQMFLGMLPILTMALLTGNMMSMSKVSEKVSGQENLDEKRIRRDSEKMGAATVIDTNNALSLDGDGNGVTATSKVEGATSVDIANQAQQSATKNTEVAKTASDTANTAYNKLVSATETTSQLEQVLNSTSGTLAVNDSVNINAQAENGGQHSETFQNLRQMATSLDIEVGAKATTPKLLGMIQMSLGVKAGASAKDTDAVNTAMTEHNLTKESVARALASVDGLQIQGTSSITGADLNSEQKSLAKTVNKQSQVATQAGIKAQKQAAFASSLSTKNNVPTSKLGEFGQETLQTINHHNEVLSSGTADQETIKESKEFADKYFGGKEELSDYVSQSSGNGRAVRAQNIRDTKGQFLEGTGINAAHMIDFMIMQELMPGSSMSELMMESPIINPAAHKDGGVSRVAERNTNQVNATDIGNEIITASGETVGEATSEAAGVQDEAETTIHNANTSLTPEQLEAQRVLKEKEKAAKAKAKAMKGEGQKAVTTVRTSANSANGNPDPAVTYDKVAGKLGITKKWEGVTVDVLEGAGDIIGNAAGNNILGDDGFTDAAVAKNREGLAYDFNGLSNKFEGRAETVFVEASDGYTSDIESGVSETEAEYNRIGKLMELLGPDASENYQKDLKNHKEGVKAKNGDLKNIDPSDFLAQHVTDLRKARIPTTIEANQKVAAGIKGENKPGWFDSFIGSDEADTYENNEQAAESALSIVATDPNAMNAEAEYQSEEILINSLKTLLEARGGETLTNGDIQFARIAAAQPYATAGGEGYEYSQMVGDLFRQNFNDKKGSFDGSGDMINKEFQSSNFGKYDDQSTNGFDRIIEQVIEAQKNNANQVALRNNSSMATVDNLGVPKIDDDLAPKTEKFLEVYQQEYSDLSGNGERELNDDEKLIAELSSYRVFAEANGTSTDNDHLVSHLSSNYDPETRTLDRNDQVNSALAKIDIDGYRQHLAASFDNVSTDKTNALPDPSTMEYKHIETVEEVLNKDDLRNGK